MVRAAQFLEELVAAGRLTEPDLLPTGCAKIVPIIAVAISVLHVSSFTSCSWFSIPRIV